MPTTDILNIAKLGLFANQNSLRVTSHNIANANTPGYVQQNAHMVPIPGLANARATGGGGVDVDQVSRRVDQMMEDRLAQGERELGRLRARDRFLPVVENTFNDLGGQGWSKNVEAFFAAADTLADNPLSPVARSQLIADGQNLATTAKKMYDGLGMMALPVDKEISFLLNDINNRLASLKEINLAVIRQESTQSKALDLKDQRQELIKELSGLLDVQALASGDGGITLMTTSGRLLMDHSYVATLTRGNSPARASGIAGVSWQGIGIDQSAVDLTDQIHGGELKGLLEVRDEVVYGTTGTTGQDGWLARLDKMVESIRFQTNRVHAQSVGSTLSTTQTGVFALGQDLNTAIKNLVTDPVNPLYQNTPRDLAVTTVTKGGVTYYGVDNSQINGTLTHEGVQNGTIRLAYGADVNTLNPTTFDVNITIADPVFPQNPAYAGMTINQVVAALNVPASPVVAAIINNRLVLTAKGGANTRVYGVVSDTSNVLAAMGVGAFFTGNTPSSMGVNPELVSDFGKVGAGRLLTDAAGNNPVFHNVDNQGSLALAAVRSRSLAVTINGTTSNSTLAAHLAGVAGNLGSLVHNNEDSYKSQQVTQDYTSELRESTSGVSMEEELTNIIKFQRSFQACGKTVTMADELVQTVLQMLK